MRNQVLACILAVSVLLVGSRAEALPDGWYMKETEAKVVLYDQTHAAVWTGYFDENGVWHETTQAPKRGGGDKGETLGDIRMSPDSVRVALAKPVAAIVVVDASRHEVVFEVRGGLEAGATVEIPSERLGDTVQLLVALDDKGATLDIASFKRMGVCGDKSVWISR
jgi:hypothetical protein